MHRLPQNPRILVIGGPLTGKSTLGSRIAREHGYPLFCTDSRSRSRTEIEGCTYAPGARSIEAMGEYVARRWLPMDGPWVLEGCAAARALRSYLRDNDGEVPVDRIIVLSEPHRHQLPRQRSLARAISTIWSELAADPRIAALAR